MAGDVKKRPLSRVKKVATGVVLVAIASIGGMGFLHTKWGKPLLMKIGGCPVATPDQVEQSQIAILAQDKATRVAPSRFALGFDLDTTTYDDVQKWAKSHSIACEDSRNESVLVCSNVPVSALPMGDGGKSTLTNVTFGFWLKDHKLNNVSGWRQQMPTDGAATDLAGMATQLQTALGDPSKKVGEPTKAWLDQAGMPVAVFEYDMAGYKASISATRLPDGVWVREVFYSSRVNQG